METRYDRAAALLPSRLRRLALGLSQSDRARAEELRLRAGRGMTVVLGEEERQLAGDVTMEELETLCDLATEFSRYAAAQTLRWGYISVAEGFRLGLCGTAVMKEGVPTRFKDLSSAVIRIGREQKGVGEEVLPQLMEHGRFCSTLILSPPGGGKTTLLRDLVRLLSDGEPHLRVALVDERGEVAAMHRGLPQMDVGRHTDVLDQCPKAVGIPMVLRSMGPQLIAVDEITDCRDIQAMTLACGCGVGLLATVHGENRTALEQKPLYRELLETKVFSRAVTISREGRQRRYFVEKLE